MTMMSACLPAASVPIYPVHRICAIRCGNVDRFQRREPCLDEQFNLALVAESGDHAAVSGGIKPGKQLATFLRKLALEFHFFLEESGPIGFRRAVGDPRAAR